MDTIQTIAVEATTEVTILITEVVIEGREVVATTEAALTITSKMSTNSVTLIVDQLERVPTMPTEASIEAAVVAIEATVLTTKTPMVTTRTLKTRKVLPLIPSLTVPIKTKEETTQEETGEVTEVTDHIEVAEEATSARTTIKRAVPILSIGTLVMEFLQAKMAKGKEQEIKES